MRLWPFAALQLFSSFILSKVGRSIMAQYKAYLWWCCRDEGMHVIIYQGFTCSCNEFWYLYFDVVLFITSTNLAGKAHVFRSRQRKSQHVVLYNTFT